MGTVIKRLIVWTIIVALAAFASLVITACQETPTGDHAFDIDTADVNVEALPDARLRVTERLKFAYSGSFHGAWRDIPLQPGVTAEDVSVSDATSESYRPGGGTVLGVNDTPGKFGVTRAPQGGLRIVWHYSQSDGTRTFTLRYTIKGAAQAYDDVVVIPWAVWGDQWEFWLNRLHARIALRGVDGKPVDAWMRPQDLGVEPVLTAQAASIAVDRAKPKTQITMTAAFPRSAFDSVAGATRHSGNGLAATAKEEEAKGRNSPLQRLGSFVDEYKLLLLFIWTALVGIVAMTLFRRSREHDSGVGKYFPGPPDDAPPALGYALAHEGGFDEKVILATLLDLVDRGFFKGEAAEGKDLDLRLSFPEPRLDITPLRPYEVEVYNFFGGLLSDGGPCELGQLKDRIPKHSASWRKRWEKMNSALQEVSEGEITFDRDLTGARSIALLVALAGYAAILGLSYVRTGLFAIPFVGLIAGLGLLYLFPGTWLTRRDEASIVRGDQWAAFGRWTKDFPNLDDDPPATLALWRRVLVHAVAFGTADRVIKSGRIPAPIAEQDNGWSRGMMYGSTYGSFSGASFSSGFSSQVAAQSSSSSGGGGGGGFSGGGGGGAWLSGPAPERGMAERPPSTLPPARWYEIRRAVNAKPSTYTCPFCRGLLPAMSEHVLVSPEGDTGRRRHAHTQCALEARAAGKLPTRDEWRASQPQLPNRFIRLRARLCRRAEL